MTTTLVKVSVCDFDSILTRNRWVEYFTPYWPERYHNVGAERPQAQGDA